MIGQSGSYSLHWSQWGHTLSDFAKPLERMRQPWRALRSLGLYKCRDGCKWGWDYVSSSSMRIGNFENGFSDDDAIRFVKNGGFPFLPSFLQSGVHEDSDNQWIDVLLSTVDKCVKGFRRTYIALLLAFLAFGVVPIVKRTKNRVACFLQLLVPLALLQLCILGTFWNIKSNIASSVWGRNIKYQRSNEVEVPFSMAPNDNPTAVLPNKEDVMVFENMQSEYLASFVDVLEVFHPGNAELARIVPHFAKGYRHLSSELQERIRNAVQSCLPWSRLLVQNAYGDWTAAEASYVNKFVHRRLVGATNPLLHATLQQLDFQQSEVRFGLWHRTSMQRKHNSAFIPRLREMILPSPPSVQPSSGKRQTGFQISGIPKLASTTESMSEFQTFFRPYLHRLLSFEAARQPPIPGGWIRQGDRVESFVQGYTSGTFLHLPLVLLALTLSIFRMVRR